MNWIDTLVPGHGTVTGQYVAISYDSSDADLTPDVQPLNGTITLTPTVTAGRIDTALAQILAVEVRVFGGQIVDDEDQPGVRVMSNDTDLGVVDWAWTARFNFESGLKLKPLTFKVATGETVNLTSGIVPVESAPYQIVQGQPGQRGMSAYEVAVAAGFQGTREQWLESLAAGRAYVDARLAPIQVGTNRWDPSVAVLGHRLASVGQLTASANYDTSGLIPVRSGSTYTLWGVGFDAPRRGPYNWAFYDSTGAFVSYGVDAAMVVKTVTAPQDGFLRVAFPNKLVPAPQIEAGSSATQYEPYQVTIPALALTVSGADLPDGVITPSKTSFAEAGKNLADPAGFKTDTFLNGGAEFALAGYTTSGDIPVTGGASYVGAVRMWAWYLADGTYVSSTNSGDNNAVNTQVAPANAALLRASWSSSRDSVMQIEQGAAATAFEPYGIRIPNLINAGGGGDVPSTGPLHATLAGDSLEVRTQIGGQDLTITSALHGSANGTFNLIGAALGGTLVSGGTDDVAPLRSFNTVGANHGYTAVSVITAPGHGKSIADLGSVWTDGVSQWTLLLVDGDKLTVGPDYTVDGAGVVSAPASAPAAALTHVSGATSTTSIPVSTVVAGAQLYPSVQRVHTTALVDGQTFGSGGQAGVTAQVRESYEVLDYASIIDTARENIGTPFHQRRVKGAVRVENVYTFKPGVILVDTALTELVPTALGSCGFVQAIRPSGTGGRIMPGVTGWVTPKPFTDTWASKVVTAADLIDPTIPPVMSLDVMDWGGFALGYFPHAGGATSSAERIEHGGSRLWDLRSTQKSYPSPFAAKPAGWGRIEGHAYRAYLTPGQAATVAAEAVDAHATHSALAAVTGL